MHLPFLPLRPTAAGTNDDEAGSSRPPAPSPAASAAIQEAFGDGEHSIVKSILAQIRAGNEEGAKEEACNAVMNFLTANGIKESALGVDDEIWRTLLQNVFPDAPPPEPPNPTFPTLGVPFPANAKEHFFDMCRRHRNARLVEEHYEGRNQLYQQYFQAQQKLKQAMRDWAASTGTMNLYELRAHRGYRRLETKLRQIEWNMTRLKSIMENMEDNQLAKARDKLTHWNVQARPPRLRRQNAMRGPDLNAFLIPQGLPPPADPFPAHTDDEDGDEDDHGINPALFGDNEDD